MRNFKAVWILLLLSIFLVIFVIIQLRLQNSSFRLSPSSRASSNTASGMLEVAIKNNPDAYWRYRTSEQEDWSDPIASGSLIYDLPTGHAYEIGFLPGEGYVAGEVLKGIVIRENQITSIVQDLQPVKGFLKVHFTGLEDGEHAKWYFANENTLWSQDEVVSTLHNYNHSIFFEEVNGYQVPPPMNVYVGENIITEITVEYTPLSISQPVSPTITDIPLLSPSVTTAPDPTFTPTESQPSTTQAPDPTATHTPTPTPQNTPRRVIENPVTPPDDCPRFAEGDATCDGNITGEDYACWREQFIAFMTGATVPITDSCPRHTDFDQNNAIGLLDYAIWRASYIREAAN